MQSAVIKKLDQTVSALILLSIVLLLLFMSAVLIKGVINIAHLFFEDREPPIERILHGIAITLIFVKAYKILVSYYLEHHISIKFMVEIAIIATTVEILFNAKSFELPMLIVITVFGIANLIIYLLFGHKFNTVDHQASK